MRALKKYLITIGIGLAAVLAMAWSQDIFHQTHPVRVLHILCDAFFVTGAVLTGAGLLVFTSNEGVYDMLVYGASSLAGAFRKKRVKKYDTFYDYRTAREERKVPFLFLVICGLLFLAVALVMYGLYSTYL